MDKFATSKYKVTYLLGAGASANALPLIKKTDKLPSLADAILELSKKVESEVYRGTFTQSALKDYANDLKWLGENSKRYVTPDTFAKYLYLTNKTDFKRLKNTLSLYFTLEQLHNQKTEERVLPFITSVLQYPVVFPSNIKILSWNYDIQFQLASDTFDKEQFNYSGGVTSHHSTMINYFKPIGRDQYSETDISNMSFIQLNGVAGYMKYESNGFIDRIGFNKTHSEIGDWIVDFNKKKETSNSMLKFAWESHWGDGETTNFDDVVNVSKQVIKDSHILVVIGYSFPFFNRKIDKAIFDELLRSENFTKVYFQDPYNEGGFLKELFDLPERVKIKWVGDQKDTYFIPTELS